MIQWLKNSWHSIINSNFSRIVSLLFGRDFWIKNATILFILLSFIIIALSFSPFFIPAVNSTLSTIGISMLTGGVFNTIIKSAQFNEIFKEEITKVLTSNNFKTKLRDIIYFDEKYSKNDDFRETFKGFITNGVSHLFPKLKSKMESTHNNHNLIPIFDSDHYYSDFEKKVVIKEAANNCLSHEESLSFTIHSTKDTNYSFSVEAKSSKDQYIISEFSVQGVDIDTNNMVVTDVNGKQVVKGGATIAAGSHKVRREMSRVFDPSDDPANVLRFTRIVENCRLEYKLDPILHGKFKLSCYTIGKWDATFTILKESDNCVTLTHNSLQLPFSGIIVVMTKV